MLEIKSSSLIIIILLLNGCVPSVPEPWLKAGFNGDEAKGSTWTDWKKLRFDSSQSHVWKKEGYTLYEAKTIICILRDNQKLKTKKQAQLWLDYLIKYQGNIKSIKKDCKIVSTFSEKWNKVGIYEPQEVQEWKRVGISYESIYGLRKQGYTPLEAKRYKDIGIDEFWINKKSYQERRNYELSNN